MNSGGAEDEGQPAVDDAKAQQMLGLLSLPDEAKDDPNFHRMHINTIKPENAMELLCAAVDTLEAISTTRTLANIGLGTKNDLSSGENTPTRVNELHFHPHGHDILQQSLLCKRFLSKREPPITLKEYLTRFHRYCPLSTGVYIAASLYITRLAIVDPVISVNRKNMHRLVLAGLRVAMKTVEDLVYSHDRVARVGGVTSTELTRLEISFCFLTDFDLRVDEQTLDDQAGILQWYLEHPI
ncbi:hypothetical protein BDW74DRAFT_156102 [Aspergillus multicolor]|uniref:putative cyclin-dependent protein kinase complex component n=1 Tax=Aspergillus multicolor TaxID=41759 RepID=UPI003CCDCED1